MARYRLDEYRFLRGKLSRNMQVWLERIEIIPDPHDDNYPIFFTEDYRQLSLVKLLKRLSGCSICRVPKL